MLLIASSAHADEEGEAHAQRLFEEGRTLLDRGRTAEACERFAASEKLSHAGGTIINLAECWLKIGRTASAYGRFREAASLARSAGRHDIEAMADKRADEIQKDLAFLTLSIDGDADVRRDGEVLPREAWGSDVPVDPGEHTIEASRPGFATYRWHGSVQRAEHVRVTATFVPLAVPPKRSTAPIVIGWSTAGVGAALLGVTAVLTGVAASQNSAASSRCPMFDRCADMMAVSQAHDAKTMADAATVTFITGVVFAAVGLGVVLAWPKAEKP
jgi:hypothetical protein